MQAFLSQTFPCIVTEVGEFGPGGTVCLYEICSIQKMFSLYFSGESCSMIKYSCI